jgi:hypothetical protein
MSHRNRKPRHARRREETQRRIDRLLYRNFAMVMAPWSTPITWTNELRRSAYDPQLSLLL